MRFGFSERSVPARLLRRVDSYIINKDLKIKLKLARKRHLHEDKSFFIIRRILGMYNGIFSDLYIYLPCLLKAQEENWIPVIDMKYCRNPYLNKRELGKKNAWEYFYEQPSEYTLEEALQCKNVILSGDLEVRALGDVFHDRNELALWHGIYHKYIKLNKKMTQYIEKEYRNIFKPAIKAGAKVLAVKFRGSDYTAIRPKGHSIQPTIEEMLEETERCMRAFNCEYVYLSVEEKKAKNAFEDKFGSKLLVYDCDLLDDFSGDLCMGMARISADEKLRVGGTRIESGIDYITTVMLLTRCNSFLTSGSSGSGLAMIIKGDAFEHVKYVDLGVYD